LTTSRRPFSGVRKSPTAVHGLDHSNCLRPYNLLSERGRGGSRGPRSRIRLIVDVADREDPVARGRLASALRSHRTPDQGAAMCPTLVRDHAVARADAEDRRKARPRDRSGTEATHFGFRAAQKRHASGLKSGSGSRQQSRYVVRGPRRRSVLPNRAGASRYPGRCGVRRSGGSSFGRSGIFPRIRVRCATKLGNSLGSNPSVSPVRATSKDRKSRPPGRTTSHKCSIDVSRLSGGRCSSTLMHTTASNVRPDRFNGRVRSRT